MGSEKKDSGKKKGLAGKLPDKVTIWCILALSAIFGGVIVNGKLTDGGKNALPTETTASVTTPQSTAFSYTATQTATSSLSLKTSASTTATTTSASETAAPTTKTTTTKKTTKEVETLVLTTVTTTTTTTTPETSAGTTVLTTETEPPTTTTSATTTTAVTTTRKTTTTRYGFPADINKITYEGLIQIPGIGEKTAREILAFREEKGVISNMELLLDIYGIGEATLKSFSTYLYVREADYQPMTTTETTTVTDAQETKTQTVTEPPSRSSVHINIADAGEIASKLLLPAEKAEAIVRVREMIGGFTAIEELLLVDELSRGDIDNIKDYVLLD